MDIGKKQAYGKYIAALLLFGSNGWVASRIALSSYEIVLLRTLIGSLLLAAILRAGKGKLPLTRPPKQLMFVVVSGMAMGASWMLLYEAYAQIGVSVASLLYYCGPVLVMAASPVLFGERLRVRTAAGFACVLCGIFLLNGTARGGTTRLGFVCGILSAVMYAVMVICNKKAADITGLFNAMLQLCSSFVTVAVFVGWKQGLAMQIPLASVAPILVLGVLNTGVGCYCYFSSIGRLPVQTVAVCGYLEPLSAVFFSVVFLRERLSPLQIAGAVMMIGGAVFAEGVARRRED